MRGGKEGCREARSLERCLMGAVLQDNSLEL